MNPKDFLLIPAFIFLLVSCHRQLVSPDGNKINFDYSNIDNHGFRNGMEAVDYEFCIPADEMKLKKCSKLSLMSK